MPNQTTTTTHRHQPAIGPNDFVSVQGRYLVQNSTGLRFVMQGIAFPTAESHQNHGYDADGWKAVLEQLAHQTSINTIRLYRVDCVNVDYHDFLVQAAELGIYVIVPLTTAAGDGVLDRNLPAPVCYSRQLYNYGCLCLDQFVPHPNVVTGLIGNEVMNSIQTWAAAPCVLAYARDLKLYMAAKHYDRFLPLAYAAQDDALSANVKPETAVKMTLDYLSCHDEPQSIDVFGINVESWCSSLQTFRYNENGVTESTYHALWRALHNASIPLVFSEMGCSKHLFNRDNGLQPRHARDWAQIPVVLQDMTDILSGFCAYAYNGSPLFRMMKNGPWNGHDVLKPSLDFENFRAQLDRVNISNATETIRGVESLYRPVCRMALQEIEKNWKLQLFLVEQMPLYYHPSGQHVFWVLSSLILVGILSGVYLYFRQSQRRGLNHGSILTVPSNYQSIHQEKEKECDTTVRF